MRRQRRLDYQPNVSLRVKLLWTRQLPTPYRRLSLNVSREISSYYTYVPDVIVHSDKGLWAFKTSSKTWQLLTPQRGVYRSLINSVFIGEAKVFLVLTEHTSDKEALPYYAIWDRGVLTNYGIVTERYGCGVAFDEAVQSVYIFGGHWDEMRMGRDHIDTCHEFFIRGNGYDFLPNLIVGRSCFGLCWHQGLLHLCGGSHLSVHTFDPKANRHSELCDLSTSGIERSVHLAASNGVEIVIISPDCILRGNGQKWVKKQRDMWYREGMEPTGTPMLVGSLMYYSQFRRCFICNINTGETTHYTMPKTLRQFY